MNRKTVCLVLAAILLLSGAPVKAAGLPAPAEPAGFEFNPHLYVSVIAPDVPQDYWDSFYSLCDALRAGETTFACSSREAYQWAVNPVTLTELFPAACMVVSDKVRGGMKPYENGVGRIYYRMPAEEYVERQARFEELIENILNSCLETDDDDFEKCLKLYDYVSAHFTYNDDFLENMTDGANYTAFMTGKGQCIELSSVYAYLLLQAGVEAMQIGCNNSDIAHAWTYVVLNGKGYHSDPTWGLRSAGNGEDLYLYYFMMNDDRRVYSGCALDDLTAPLLPRYWVSFSSSRFTADDTEYCFPDGAYLISLDETDRVVRYSSYGAEYECGY